jgi:hypothetical protein
MKIHAALRRHASEHRTHRVSTKGCIYCDVGVTSEFVSAITPPPRIYDAPLTRFLDQQRTNRGGFAP